VLPLWRDGEETQLWGASNPWLEAWSIAGTADELVPVLAPAGDLGDISAIDAPRALGLDLNALRTVAANYGSAHVLVALAQPAEVEGQVVARLVGVDFSQGGRQTDYGSVGPAEPLDVARAAAALLQEGWKRTMAVSDRSLTTAEVSVLYGSIDEWMELQGVIGGEPLVRVARLEALTDDGALMTIEHRGTPDQLALVLLEHGTEVAATQGGGLVMRMAVGAAPRAARSAGPPASDQPAVGVPPAGVLE
jgi:hypothetical protein